MNIVRKKIINCEIWKMKIFEVIQADFGLPISSTAEQNQNEKSASPIQINKQDKYYWYSKWKWQKMNKEILFKIKITKNELIQAHPV